MLTIPALPEVLAQETRSERMEQRVKPSIKRTIEMAAALAGTDTSDFVVLAAYHEAVRRFEDFSLTRLNEEEAKSFFAGLDRCDSPTDAMRHLMADYEAGVVNAIR
jgi:uncharacterized protein (DUF1778 family)